MSTTIKVKITREILQQSANCPRVSQDTATSCAIALAIRDIFPEARVHVECTIPFHIGTYKMAILNEEQLIERQLAFRNAFDMEHFIRKFDTTQPSERATMPECEFALVVPDWAIERLTQNHVDFVQAVIDSPTLEIIEP